MSNKNLLKSYKKKNDEYYTPYNIVVKKLEIYKDYFKDKIIYLPCDDYRYSNYFKYFQRNYKELKYKKIIANHYTSYGKPVKAIFNGDHLFLKNLSGDGDFLSDECKQIALNSDIVVTNPPFSKIRAYYNFLMGNNINFILMAPLNIASYYPLVKDVKDKKVFLSNLHKLKFNTNNGIKEVPCSIISTYNVYNNKLNLTKNYNSDDYQFYDNYNAIEVSYLKNIPKDYKGLMGVPITYLGYHNKDFEIIEHIKGLKIDGKHKFQRIIIKRREG